MKATTRPNVWQYRYIISRDKYALATGFIAGTLVDGTPIEEIQVGDTVTAYNHDVKWLEICRVTKVVKEKAPFEMIQIGNNIICTLSQNIYSYDDKRYMLAEKLCSLTATLLEYKHKCLGVVHAGVIKKIPSNHGFVYNLEVEGLNNFFANGYLVHDNSGIKRLSYAQPLEL